MEKIKLKVCGMRDPQNIQELASLSPDYMGFIFYSTSPRYVGPEFTLPPGFPSAIKKVGVFVNETNEVMLQQANRHSLEYLQLHGTESVQQCEALKATGIGVIKVFSVDDDFDFESTTPYKQVADYFLFDTKGKHYGGNAQTFNWKVLECYDQQIPFFLSGGLMPDNVIEIVALKAMNIYALDVNSGVEVGPGLKDLVKINVMKELMVSL